MIDFTMSHGPRSLLIQDVHELRAECRLLWWGEIRDYELDERLVLEWLIVNWLRTKHGLYYPHHNPHDPAMHAIKRWLASFMEFPIESIFDKYIVAPQLYRGCRDITVELRGVDLYIWYFKQQL